MCFYQQSTLLIIFILLLCRISWHLDLCRPFHVHNTINPAGCQKKEAVMFLKCKILSNIYICSCTANGNRLVLGKWVGNFEMFMSSNTPVVLSKNPVSAPLPFCQEHLTHSASDFQKFFEIVCFWPIFLDDIEFLFLTVKNLHKVRGKIKLSVSLAVMWGKDFKINDQCSLSAGEWAESLSEMWMKPHVNLKIIISTGKGFPKAFSNLVKN